ncbi:MAG: ATP-binding protein [Solirubrobacterales bacterium]|nr:ATP-binding protein [Solirubrobacterales bacterium]
MNTCPDDRCDGSGFVFDESNRRASDCSCRPRRIAKRKARSLAAVIPRRYQGVSFDRPPVTQIQPHVVNAVRRYVDTLPDQLARGRGIWFEGDVGTGKTTLAMLVSAEALRRGHSVAIYSLPRLLGVLRDSYGDGPGPSLGELLDRLTAVELLHIDDVGAEKTSPWVIEQLYSIVNARYEDGRAIMGTTNLSDHELRDQIGDRTVSRLIEICGDPLPLFGEDARMQVDLALPEPAPGGVLRYGDQAPGPFEVPDGESYAARRLRS